MFYVSIGYCGKDSIVCRWRFHFCRHHRSRKKDNTKEGKPFDEMGKRLVLEKSKQSVPRLMFRAALPSEFRTSVIKKSPKENFDASAPSYSFTRSTYSPVRVSTLILSPFSTKFGTLISAPVSTFAGFVTFVAVLPRIPGSVYSTSKTT